ncbi:MAG: trehalase family glycosidase [Protaetiibacter sp.]
MTELGLDLLSTPFSRRGSYLAVSRLAGRGRDGVFLRTVHGDARQRELLRFQLDGVDVPSAQSTPGRLTLSGGDARLEISFDGGDRATLRLLRGTAVLDVQVDAQYDVVLQEGPAVWRFIASGAVRNYRITVDGGDPHLDSGWDGVKDTAARLMLTAADGPVTVTVDGFAMTAPQHPPADPDAIAAEAERDYEAWLALHGTPTADPVIDHASRLAAYVTWSALVPAGGVLRRESMLMSKNWMTNVWAWDHCFNALALWHDPAAAADQLLTLFDHQDAAGGLPDFVNDAGVQPNFVKPPIHGWTVGYLLDRGGLAPATAGALYEPLSRWTHWWFAHRDFGGDGVPSYTHGNDSGWDNSTVFAEGVPLQSPDLLAFLALQMTTLARIADSLGRVGEAVAWRERADATVDLMLERFWTGDRFIARHTLSQRAIESESLLTLMPLVLGDQLPPPVFDRTVRRLLEGGYLTEHGVATEPVTSPHYVSDGYWRGPVWAPTTMLLVDGLRRGGRSEIADDLARRFIDTCAAGGMAENFDALTGDGLRDLSMTWTASVYLALLSSPSPASTAATLGAGGKALA